MFGHLNDQVESVRYNNSYNPLPLEQRSPELAAVFKYIESGAFGDGGIYGPLLKTVSRSRPTDVLTADYLPLFRSMIMTTIWYADCQSCGSRLIL